MKNILFSAYSLDVGGIETALITLLKEIQSEFEITLVLEKVEGIFLKEVPKSVKIIQYKPCDFKVSFIRKAINFIKQQKFKIKYKNKFDFSVCYATYSYSASFVARQASKNNLIWVHNDYLSFYNNDVDKYKEFYNKLKIDKFKKIVFVSQKDENTFIKYFPDFNNKCDVCNNLIDYKKIQNLSKEKIEDFEKSNIITFINIGRHEEKQKKLSRIIEATEKLNKEGYKFNVIFIGDGENFADYKKMAQNIQNIKFLGAKKNPYPYLKLSDCMIMSSDYEGYPVVFIESLILNKPIITTDVSDSKKDIEGKYGLIVEKSTTGIYDGMKRFLEEGFVPQEFNPERYNQEILNKIRKFIN